MKRPESVPILSYHDVAPEPHPAFRRYSLTVREFARQMQWLARRHYTPIDMDTLAATRGGGTLPARPIVITFDDGFRTCAEHAVPVLQAHGFTAVFFLVTGLMGSTSRWMADRGVNLALMTWDAARRIADEGFQCGVHTATHPRLTAIDSSRRRFELADARRQLEDELGRPAVHFAYPYGAVDSSVRASVAEAGYVTACATRPGRSSPDDDLLALRRITIHGDEPILRFAWRVATGRGVRDSLRAALRRRA
jgi:peptidoglycan/xylan/chitin deacetylase (PgdA/CDA1 family)